MELNYCTRLKKKADKVQSEIEQLVMNSSDYSPAQQNVMQNSLQNIANEGRQILKFMDDYKFKLIQSLNAFKDEKLKKRLEQKQKILTSAASLVYSIVFDLENINITPDTYEEEQFNISNVSNANDENDINDMDSQDENEQEINEKEITDETDESSEGKESTDDEEEEINFNEPKMQGNLDDIFDDIPEDISFEDETEKEESKKDDKGRKKK